MPAAIATFVLCLTIIIGVYWMFVVRPEEGTARTLRKRLLPSPANRPQPTELTRKAPPLSALKALDSLLARSGSVILPLQRVIALSALPVTVGMVLLACGLVAMLTFLVVWSVTSLAWLALLLALAAAPLPYWSVQVAARRRMRRLEELFPQAVDQIAVSLRAGHAFSTGLLMVAEEVADPLGAEFRLVYDRQNYGKPLPDVLKEFAERVPLLDVRIFVTAVLTQRETGGNLALIFARIINTTRERKKIEQSLQTLTIQGKIQAVVMTGLPVLFYLGVSASNPRFFDAMKHSPDGQKMLILCLILWVLGAVSIWKISALKET